MKKVVGFLVVAAMVVQGGTAWAFGRHRGEAHHAIVPAAAAIMLAPVPAITAVAAATRCNTRRSIGR